MSKKPRVSSFSRSSGCWIPTDQVSSGTAGPQIAAVVEANELAIATSGAYARGDHVIDPYSGRAPEGVLSVTVVGRELATADAYATAAYAMGPDFGPPWTAQLRGYEAMTIHANGTVLSTGRFPAVQNGDYRLSSVAARVAPPSPRR